MEIAMKFFLPVFFLLILSPCAYGQSKISDATRDCLNCHATITPGIVSSWEKSRHAVSTLAEALKLEGLDRKVSPGEPADELKSVAVGCAECHTLRPKAHADTFDHNGSAIHTIVTPQDCSVCHRVEAEQFQKNLMSHAHGNLTGNRLYQSLVEAINAVPAATKTPPQANAYGKSLTDADSCLYCHGTKIDVSGRASRETALGEMEFPVFAGWPNQGVGRINPDGSKGTCSACHSRHDFSIETARKPYTCKECHSGPDVPATKVYETSKHGNIFLSENKNWDFRKTPWSVGKDFTAPTCASCHISLLVDPEGKPIANRTHEIKDRLPWRIFGLVYAHPHPRDPDTTIIRNRDGLPLPTDFRRGNADKFLLTGKESEAARQKMQAVCLACHSRSWVDGHWTRFLNTIETSNSATFAATETMLEIWKLGLAKGYKAGGNPFDESIERTWTDIWLFYGNSVRFTSAMAGGGDYGVFADGRYRMRKSIQELREWFDARRAHKGRN